jgi:Cof subfamily protein (haloacid dehalogenase superfamily)
VTTLYVSDLDGTLLQSDASLSSASENALREMLADGLLFTVASARSVVAIQQMLRGLPLPLPVIEFNGAYLSDLSTGRHELINALEPSVAVSVYGQILAYGLTPLIASFDGTDDRVHYGEMLNEGMHWFLQDRLAHRDSRWRGATADLAASLREQVVCLTTIAKEEELTHLQAAILQVHADRVETHLFENQYFPGWHWLTVHDCRATKDQAIKTLVKNYGLGDAQVVVFGDHINDLKMFAAADLAVAVGNAQAEVKACANLVIGTSAEDSVVKFICEHRQSRRAPGIAPMLD